MYYSDNLFLGQNKSSNLIPINKTYLIKNKNILCKFLSISLTKNAFNINKQVYTALWV